MWLLYVVIGTTIWVGYDASANHIPVTEGKEYSLNTGAVAWMLMCLLFWIVSFPYYLVRRSRELTLRTSSSAANSADVSSRTLGDLEKLGELKSRGVLTDAEFEVLKRRLFST